MCGTTVCILAITLLLASSTSSKEFPRALSNSSKLWHVYFLDVAPYKSLVVCILASTLTTTRS